MIARKTTWITAFTLIELLVVVAILALLISILLPTLARARSKSREIKCRTQLREYARGFHYYFGEYNDVFPAADYGIGDNEITPPTWYQLVEKYWFGNVIIDQEQDRARGEQYPLGRCPELGDLRTNNNVDWEWEYSWKSFGYGYNRFWLGWNEFERGLFRPEQAFWRRCSTVVQPTECLLVADSGVRVLGLHPAVGSIGHYLGWSAIAEHGAGVDTRHGTSSLEPTVVSEAGGNHAFYLNGSGNIAWVDGHVTSRTSPEINDKWRLKYLWDPTQTEVP